MKAPEFNHLRVHSLLRQQYGLDGELSTLVSERDQNLALDTSDGQRYVIKIANREESQLAAGMQAAALLHLAGKATHLDVPRVVRARDGALLTDLDGHIVRVSSWVEGRVLERKAITPAVATSLGRALAVLGEALRDFEHEGAHRPLTWNMEQALQLRYRTSGISDADLRDLVDAVFDEFEARALPQFLQLRRQVIHNDVNPENVLVSASDSKVSGIIDFGDVVDAPLIVDVAVAGSYLRDLDNPSSLLAPFIRGYQQVTPLREDELALLHLLLRVRLSTTITMFYWRSLEFGDDVYRQKTEHTEGQAERFLRLLTATSEGSFLDQLSS